MAATGEQILDLARTHVGEKYILGSFAPKNNRPSSHARPLPPKAGLNRDC